MTTVPARTAKLHDFVDAKIAAAREADRDTMRATFGRVVQLDPLRVQLDEDDAPIGYEPPCTYRPQLGDRVVCGRFGTAVAVLGPVSGGPLYEPAIFDTGWVQGTPVTDTGFDQSAYADKAQYRQIGQRVDVRGTLRWVSGSLWGLGMMFVPAPSFPGDHLVGEAVFTSGGRTPLHVNTNGVIFVPGEVRTGTFTLGTHIRVRATYYRD